MKKLLLLFFSLATLDGFSQVQTLESKDGPVLIQAPDGTFSIKHPEPKPDTLRAIVLVTMSPNGIAHARMGYVVVQPGKPTVYLDCRKRPLKLPAKGWMYEVVGPKEGKR